MQEALAVVQQVPRFDAQDQVKALLASQQLGEIDLASRLCSRGQAVCGELALDGIVANHSVWFEMTREELEVICLSVRKVEHAEAL